MPRENSFSDSDGRSLTPDLEDEFIASPLQTAPPMLLPSVQTDVHAHQQPPRASVEGLERNLSAPASIRERGVRVQTPTPMSPHRPRMAPIDKFRSSVRKVIAMRRGSTAMVRSRVGAEPGIDPRRDSAYLTYGHIRDQCTIEITDYSALTAKFGRMDNRGFIEYLSTERACAREPWVRVRWINIGGVSWDVISALAIKYGACASCSWRICY